MAIMNRGPTCNAMLTRQIYRCGLTPVMALIDGMKLNTYKYKIKCIENALINHVNCSTIFVVNYMHCT